MSEEGRIFLEDCGATGPLQLEWSDWNSEEMIRRVFDQPSVMVGRNADADLCLDHARVSKRHAYVQMIEGRLYAIDLDSRDGLRWSDVPRPAGWIDPRRPMQLGPTTIGVVESGVVEGEAPGAGPGPLSRRFASRHTLPGAVLEIRGDGVEPTRWPMDRVLTLVGCAPACKVRLLESGTSRYACALVRTPKGVWVVDLLSSRGVTVNGVARRRARLEDGDSIQIGGQSIRLTYDGLRSSTPSNLPSRPGRIPTDLNREAWELVPDLVLGQLQGRGNPASETAAVPFDHALMMLVQLLGEIHRDHIEIVREEMEQIRQLNQEMVSLRSQLPQSQLKSPPAPTAGTIKGIITNPEDSVGPRLAVDTSTRDRPAPEVVQSMVSERLAVWEKERQSRWRKVMDLLVKP